MQSVADMLKRGRLRWIPHLERESVDNWGLVRRNVEVAGVRCRDRSSETLRECTVNSEMKVFGVQPEWAIFTDMRR